MLEKQILAKRRDNKGVGSMLKEIWHYVLAPGTMWRKLERYTEQIQMSAYSPKFQNKVMCTAVYFILLTTHELLLNKGLSVINFQTNSISAASFTKSFCKVSRLIASSSLNLLAQYTVELQRIKYQLLK